MVRGLSHHQVSESRRQHGANVLPEAALRSGWVILRDQFRSGLVWLLLAAAGISTYLGDILDGMLIVAIVVVNSVIGWWQEHKAERAISQLKNMHSFTVRLWRADRQQEVDSSEVVVGDVVHLAEG